MLTSLALILLSGLFLGGIFDKLKLPRLVGMLLAGIILGPHILNLLDLSILGVSAELRELALIIILIKAGLSLEISDLRKIGRPALLMSFLPALFEILAFVIFAPTILGVSRLDAAIMGAVLGAVSPAVVVPKMVELMEKGYGKGKGIPQLILAGASLDDIFVIVLFTAFTGLAQGNNVSVWSFAAIPVSIVVGLAVGFGVGLLLSLLFGKLHMRDSVKVIIILGLSFLLAATEKLLENIVPMSGLLAVMSMAGAIRVKIKPAAERLSLKFSKLWVAAEILLFALVGAAVDIGYAANSGTGVVLMILLALLMRMAGVYLSLLKTQLNLREKYFCMISYIPKATVQAAIGSVPLALGLPCGQIVLTVAVLSIIITAPLGAFGMDISYKKLLSK